MLLHTIRGRVYLSISERFCWLLTTCIPTSRVAHRIERMGPVEYMAENSLSLDSSDVVERQYFETSKLIFVEKN
jgi:hypothetical protein